MVLLLIYSFTVFSTTADATTRSPGRSGSGGTSRCVIVPNFACFAAGAIGACTLRSVEPREQCG